MIPQINLKSSLGSAILIMAIAIGVGTAQTNLVTSYDLDIAAYNPDGTLAALGGTSVTYPWLSVENYSSGIRASQSMLTFAVSSAFAPSSVIVTKAELWLSFDRGTTTDIELYTLDSSFNWTNPAARPTWNSVGGGLGAGELDSLVSATGTMGSNWFDGTLHSPATLKYDLNTALIQNWINNPASNNGFALQQKAGGVLATTFASKEHGSVHKPTLRIWTTPVPEPSSAVICIMAGMLGLLHRKRN